MGAVLVVHLRPQQAQQRFIDQRRRLQGSVRVVEQAAARDQHEVRIQRFEQLLPRQHVATLPAMQELGDLSAQTSPAPLNTIIATDDPLQC